METSKKDMGYWAETLETSVENWEYLKEALEMLEISLMHCHHH